MGRVTHGEVTSGLGNRPGGLRPLGRPSGRSGSGRETLPMVRDRSQDPLKGLGQVEVPSQKSGTGRYTLPEVQHGSSDPIGGPGRVRGPSGRSVTSRGMHG